MNFATFQGFVRNSQQQSSRERFRDQSPIVSFQSNRENTFKLLFLKHLVHEKREGTKTDSGADRRCDVALLTNKPLGFLRGASQNTATKRDRR
jgi:hypothetical protein